MSNPEQKGRRGGRVLLAVVIAAALAAASLYLLRRAPAAEYRTFNSPDGRYRVVVYRYPSPFAMVPGQSGDAPGFVRLYDGRGHTLAEAGAEMVQTVDRVDWEDGKVNVKLIAEWPLPR
jgi:hypothetical protein